MALNFPSPALQGDTYTASNGITYTYDGTKWLGTVAPTGGVTGWTVDQFNSLNPNTDNLQDIGTPTNRVRHIYVGPGSVTIGDSVLSESVSGKLVVPGLTRGTGYTVDEVEDTRDQTYSFSSDPVVIDYAYFELMSGNILGPDAQFTPASYEVTGLDGDGYIDGIHIISGGSGITQTVASLIRANDMLAYIGTSQDPIGQWNRNDWISIPFRARPKAADTEYEFSTGGGVGGGITVGLFDAEDSLTDEVSNVTTIGFDSTTGFNVTEMGDGVMKVSLGSSWKTWKVDGQDDLVAQGEDTVTFVAGTNMSIETNANDKTITFNSTGSGGGGSSNQIVDGLTTFSISDNQQRLTFNYDGTDNFIMQMGGSELLIDSMNGNIRLSANDDKDWIFDSNGKLKLPIGGDIIDHTGQSVLGGGGGNPFDQDLNTTDGPSFNTLTIDTGNINLGTNASITNAGELRFWSTNTDITVYRNGQDGYGVKNGSVEVYAQNTRITDTTHDGLEIVHGHLKFPDNSIQTTAYTGGSGGESYRIVNSGYELSLDDTGITHIPTGGLLFPNGSFIRQKQEEGLILWQPEFGGDSTDSEYVGLWYGGNGADLDSPNVSITAGTYNFAVDDGNLEYLNYANTGADQGTYQVNIDIVDPASGNILNWHFDTSGNLYLPADPAVRSTSGIVFGDGSVQTTAYSGGGDVVFISPTAPGGNDGKLWFNSTDGRSYIKYNGAYVDLSPAVVAPRSTYTGDLEIENNTITNLNLDNESVKIVPGIKTWQFTDNGITFPDGTEQTTAFQPAILEIDGGDASTWLTA